MKYYIPYINVAKTIVLTVNSAQKNNDKNSNYHGEYFHRVIKNPPTASHEN